jgi:hypothetical protein
MALTSEQRAALTQLFMSDHSATRTNIPISKADIRAAINAVDDWCDTNAASFNTAIPQPARGALSSTQKALLLSYVALRRVS